MDQTQVSLMLNLIHNIYLIFTNKLSDYRPEHHWVMALIMMAISPALLLIFDAFLVINLNSQLPIPLVLCSFKKTG